MDRGGRHALEESIDAAIEVDLVVDALNGCQIRSTIPEAQCADACLDRVSVVILAGTSGAYVGGAA
jgi:hypothetical protein